MVGGGGGSASVERRQILGCKAVDSKSSFCMVLMCQSVQALVLIYVVDVAGTRTHIINESLQVTQDRRVMQEKLLEVFCELDIDKNGELTKEELAQSLNDSQIKDILLKNEIQDEELHWLFEVLDRDGSETLTIEEFVNGVMALKSSEQARDLVSMQYQLFFYTRSVCSTTMMCSCFYFFNLEARSNFNSLS